MTGLLASADPISHVAQHTLFPGGSGNAFLSFPIISNHIFMQVLGAALILWLIPKAVARQASGDTFRRLVPSGAYNAIEWLCLTLRENIFRPSLRRHTDRFTPYLWSLFFFLLIANVLGLFPLSDWFGAIHPSIGHLIGGTSTANFYVTGTLAICTLVLVVYNGLRFNGIEYLKHFFVGPWWIAWMIAPIEFAGLFFKCGALCIRLTANMLAGHILLAVLLSFVNQAGGLFSGQGFAIAIPVIIGSVLVYFLEVLVAFLHAFIFTMLTAVFLGMAVNIHHDEHKHADEHAAGAAVAAQ